LNEEKDLLQKILGLFVISQNSAGHCSHESGVSPEQVGERFFVTFDDAIYEDFIWNFDVVD